MAGDACALVFSTVDFVCGSSRVSKVAHQAEGAMDFDPMASTIRALEVLFNLGLAGEWEEVERRIHKFSEFKFFDWALVRGMSDEISHKRRIAAMILANLKSELDPLARDDVRHQLEDEPSPDIRIYFEIALDITAA